MPYIGKSPEHGNFSELTDVSGSFNGSTTQFALTTRIGGIAITPVVESALLISLDGVIQEPTTDYTVSGTNITFTTAPASTVSFFGVVMGRQLDVGTPSDGTITQAKLATTFMTGATDIGAAIVDADLMFIDDGAGGTLRKATMDRFKTYVAASATNPASADGDSLGTASLEWSDLYLADSSVIYFGNDQDVTLTHSPDAGLTLAGTLGVGAITGTSTIQGTTITATTAVVPDASDGATLGSASLEWSDLYIADGGVIYFGDDQEITLTHNADDGLILKHVGTGDGKEPSLTFQAGDIDIAVDDVLGSIFFQAPDEGAGTDAILVAAGIEAVSEGDFSSSSNATKLSFKTASSAAAAETMFLSSGGALQVSSEVSAESFSIPITLNGTDGSYTDAGDNIVLDASASGVDAGERLLFEGIPITIPDNSVTLSMLQQGGTDGQVLTSTGATSAPAFEDAGGGGFNSWQIFDASGTWTKPSGIKTIRVIVVGAGGGGGDDTNGSGGGAGGTGIKVIDVSSIASETVTIGTGGGDASNAAAGGTSSFGSHVSCTGGGGGTSSYGYAGAGGVGSSGDFNAKGGRGNVAYGQNYGGGQGGTPALYGVHGGGCGYGQWLADTDAQFGGGGGGNGYGTSGLHGGDGLCIVEEYK